MDIYWRAVRRALCVALTAGLTVRNEEFFYTLGSDEMEEP